MATSRAPSASAVPRDADLHHGVVVHYHEIGLKGRNRGMFERQLVRNLVDATAGCHVDGVDVLFGRLLVRTPEPPAGTLLAAIGSTCGVATFAPCALVEPDVDAMGRAAIGQLPADLGTFAVAARRATKELPLTSHEINVALGDVVRLATKAKVDLDDPDHTVYVEVVGPRALVYTDRRPGPGGLPVGVSGRVLSLLSGGIDSPVATYRMLKRGARCDIVHFHSEPFTDRSSTRKAVELAGMLARFGGRMTLYLVPLGDAQQAIVASAPPALRVVLYRRFMVRIAGELAARTAAQALVTGDSLGQVASQTLENLICTDDASPLPLLRPLIGTDKQEIVDEARRLGTFDTSILPFQDCCSLFVPRSPATRARVDDCRAAEADLDVGALVASCLERTQTQRIERPRCEEATG